MLYFHTLSTKNTSQFWEKIYFFQLLQKFIRLEYKNMMNGVKFYENPFYHKKTKKTEMKTKTEKKWLKKY